MALNIQYRLVLPNIIFNPLDDPNDFSETILYMTKFYKTTQWLNHSIRHKRLQGWRFIFEWGKFAIFFHIL
jgi:hypothetical protein